ncbi:MAG: thermonuclease family protein [Parasphingorhabdus sp.]|uniref:thermonuclease family protein n=1 Tax=Parasphingorhabdus sp. TaxID=2709688 RepID=UPI003298DDE9
MSRSNVKPFPPARQREALRRAKRKPRNPWPSEKPKPSLSWPAFTIITLAACTALFAAIWFSGGPPSSQSAVIDPHRASFGICFGSVRTNCVVDGDTFWFEGRKIRIADINTPEISNPGCASEKRLGERAKMRLLALLNEGNFDLKGDMFNDTDQYGRALRVVSRSGKSLGAQLVDEGLAEEWQGYRRGWC